MATKVVLPQLGEAVIEGTITSWYKQEGDPVEELEPLLEVNTDKVDTEIPSPVSGVLLKIVAQPGETVPVGGLLAWIGDPGEAIPEGEGEAPAAEAAPLAEEAAPAAPPEPETAAAAPAPPSAAFEPVRPGRHPRYGYISPVVAKMVNEHQVPLAAVRGSGQGGRITKEDVLAYLERRPAAPPPPAPAPAPTPPSAPAPAAPPPAPPTPAPAAPAPAYSLGTLVPHTVMRQRIAEHMVRSKRTSPHVLTVMEADLSRVIAHRAAHKEAFARQGVKLTFTPYFVLAAVAALKAHPLVNSSWREEGILIHDEINIGMATDLGEEGLIVPVIKGADNLSLLGVARAVNDLANRARAHQLKPDEVQGGTFTITNHGVSGSLFAMPIINQPQCAIMGVGKIQKRPVVVTDASGNDAIAIRPMVYLSLTFDHRILDGAAADHFLSVVVDTLQTWT